MHKGFLRSLGLARTQFLPGIVEPSRCDVPESRGADSQAAPRVTGEAASAYAEAIAGR